MGVRQRLVALVPFRRYIFAVFGVVAPSFRRRRYCNSKGRRKQLHRRPKFFFFIQTPEQFFFPSKSQKSRKREMNEGAVVNHLQQNYTAHENEDDRHRENQIEVTDHSSKVGAKCAREEEEDEI